MMSLPTARKIVIFHPPSLVMVNAAAAACSTTSTPLRSFGLRSFFFGRPRPTATRSGGSFGTAAASGPRIPGPIRTLWVGNSIRSERTARTDPTTTTNNNNNNLGLRRWKHHKNHGARLGNHLITLDEIAHESSRAAAQEKRLKKKEKAAQKKKKSSSSPTKPGDQEEDDDDEEGEDAEHPDQNKEDEEEEDDDHQDSDGLLPNLAEIKARLQQVVTRYTESLAALRGAEPTPALFDPVRVDAYGQLTPLSAVAQVVIVSPTLATATCYDPALAKAVRVALAQQLDLNPLIDGENSGAGVVRIPLPRPSLETRQKTAATLGQRTEQARQRLRQVRRTALDPIKKLLVAAASSSSHASSSKKGSSSGAAATATTTLGISKDEAFRLQEEIEAATEAALKQINQAFERKQESILSGSLGGSHHTK